MQDPESARRTATACAGSRQAGIVDGRRRARARGARAQSRLRRAHDARPALGDGEARREPRRPHRAGRRREPVDHRRAGARRRAASAGARVGDPHRHRHRARGRSGADRARSQPRPARSRAAARRARFPRATAPPACSLRATAGRRWCSDRDAASRAGATPLREARRPQSSRMRSGCRTGASTSSAVLRRLGRARVQRSAGRGRARARGRFRGGRPRRRDRASTSRRRCSATRRSRSFALPQPLRALCGATASIRCHDVRTVGADLRLTLRPVEARRLMFTGIVQGVGTVRAVEPRGGDVTLVFDTGERVARPTSNSAAASPSTASA